MSWTYHPELLATPVPRYTSYPTAAEFQDGFGAEAMLAGLASVEEGDALSLYLHIPYCHEICWYCGCNTGAANKAQRLASYLDALEAEIDLVSNALASRGKVRRIAFGGGSPNAISGRDFLRLVSRLQLGFDCRDVTLSVELDPRSLERSFVAAMAAAGVSRASLGVQSFAPHVQQAIGRVQPLALVRDAVAELRQAKVSSINFDLMYGLPGQTRTDLEETLRATVEMMPERIALFGYAHVPHLIPRQRRIDDSALAGAAERFAQAELGHSLLTGAGYEPVGFDHFARPDDPLAVAQRNGSLRRNFQGFTDESSRILIGLGASAISDFPDRILQNEKNAGRYRMLVSGRQLAAARGLLRSTDDLIRGRIIEDILCRGEADISKLCPGSVPDRLRPFCGRDVVAVKHGRVQLRAGALPYARAIAASFDRYRQPGAQRFSNAI